MSQEEAFNLGKQGGDGSVAGQEAYNTIFSEDYVRQIIDFDTGSPEHSQFWTGDQGIVQPQLQSGFNLNVQCNMGNDPENDQQRCEAVRMINQAAESRGIADMLIKKDDSMILLGKQIMADPEAYGVGGMGHYTDCKEVTLDHGGDFEYEVCGEELAHDPDDVFCSIGHVLDIDADHLYQCRHTLSQLGTGQCSVGNVVDVDWKKRYQCDIKPENRQTLNCNRTLVVTCRPGGGNCDIHGVDYSSVRQIYTSHNVGIAIGHDFGTGRMRFSTTQNSGIALSTTQFEFSVVGVSNIARFELTHLVGDDIPAIQMNDDFVVMHISGRSVYGPKTGGSCSSGAPHYGGNDNCLTRFVRATSVFPGGFDVLYNGTCTGTASQCPTTQASRLAYPQLNRGDIGSGRNHTLDIRHLLKEGKNVLSIHNANGYSTAMWSVTFFVHWYCDPICTDTWDDGCLGLGL
ncbi:MAG: hypothetical protein FWH15_03730 [Betaproteobacteria bacterium]|nr:hypothetical protein [Betaproteobacteria bacterium]